MSDIENGNSTDIRAPFYPHEARRRSQAYSVSSLWHPKARMTFC
jgi:hypothetical protein